MATYTYQQIGPCLYVWSILTFNTISSLTNETTRVSQRCPSCTTNKSIVNDNLNHLTHSDNLFLINMHRMAYWIQFYGFASWSPCPQAVGYLRKWSPKIGSLGQLFANCSSWHVSYIIGLSHTSKNQIQTGLSLILILNLKLILLSTARTGIGLCLLLIPAAGCDQTAVMSLLIVSMLFYGLASGGDVPMPGEMSNHFPATLFALINFSAASAGFVAPYMVGLILESNHIEIKRMWNGN